LLGKALLLRSECNRSNAPIFTEPRGCFVWAAPRVGVRGRTLERGGAMQGGAEGEEESLLVLCGRGSGEVREVV
jgi:hypothetical protein